MSMRGRGVHALCIEAVLSHFHLHQHKGVGYLRGFIIVCL